MAGDPVAFLFTDVEDSTALWDREPDAMREALSRHDAILRDAIERNGGRVFKTAGDAFYAAFDEASRAASAATDARVALRAAAWPTAKPIRVRMALHAGEAYVRDGDYYGPALNVTARLLSLAHGGQTLLSAPVREAWGPVVRPEVRVERQGHYRLKGVEHPVDVFELGEPSVTPFEPPLDATPGYRVVKIAELWQPVRTIRHNLPAERDAFVGRGQELLSLSERLDRGARLVTVVGPGGTGKTRLVSRYCAAWLGDWPGGICFCDLSEARTLDGIVSAAGVSLDVPLSQSDGVAQLGHAIAARGRFLMVLDNFEQVLEHAPATLGRWMERATDAVFVVTSRERLHLPGEEVHVLEPMTLQTDAVELFVARARAQRSEFGLTPANRDDVGRIVRLLDGLPLAIELAAARVRVLSPGQIVERLRDRFALLAGARGAVARQATLKAAIDWSWDLLEPWERAMLAQCSVFEGGFTLELAEKVIDLSAWPDAPPVMDGVQSLVDKSLLRAWTPAGEHRFDVDELYFGMYVSIHEYAAEKLRALSGGAGAAAEERHGRAFAALGTEAAVDALYGPEGGRRRRSLALELDNLVAACRRAVARGDGDCAVLTLRALWEVLDLRGPVAMGARLSAQVLAMDTLTVAQRARASVTRARALAHAGKSSEAEAHYRQALALAVEGGEARLEAGVRSNLGNLLCYQGRMDEARGYLEESLAAQSAQEFRRSVGNTLSQLGRLHVDQGRIEEGCRYYEQALAIQREVGNRIEEASTLLQMAVVFGESGQLSAAQSNFEQALAISRELGDRVAEAEALNNLGCVHQDLGNLERAAQLYEEALVTHREVGNRRFEGYALGDLGRVHLELGRLNEAAARLEASRAIARETGNRRIEGSELRSLGELALLQGQLDRAREAFDEAERLLRDVGDKYYLALVLCGRGELECRTGEAEKARATLEEARGLAAEMRAGVESLLGRRVGGLERAVGAC